MDGKFVDMDGWGAAQMFFLFKQKTAYEVRIMDWSSDVCSSGLQEVWPGRSYPLGATYDGAGTNFSLFSEVAERVELCLFDDDGTEQRFPLEEVDARSEALRVGTECVSTWRSRRSRLHHKNKIN